MSYNLALLRPKVSRAAVWLGELSWCIDGPSTSVTACT